MSAFSAVFRGRPRRGPRRRLRCGGLSSLRREVRHNWPLMLAGGALAFVFLRPAVHGLGITLFMGLALYAGLALARRYPTLLWSSFAAGWLFLITSGHSPLAALPLAGLIGLVWIAPTLLSVYVIWVVVATVLDFRIDSAA